jgi:hypothetical protein
MVNSKQLQNLYNDMYKIIRERLWPISVIEALANVEISIYEVIPDLSTVRKWTTSLEREVIQYSDKSEYLDDLLISIRDIIEYIDDGPSFLKLDVVTEVISK